MAGRSEARIFTSIWKDKDFLALTGPAQRLYFFLLSQPELTHCGVMPLRPPTRWVRYGSGLTVEEIQAALKELESGGPNPFVLTDSETGELLVRSLIRRDRVARQPYVFTSAVESLDEVASPLIRAAILTELERAKAEGDVNDKVLPKLETLIDTLRAEVGQTLPERVSETLPESVRETQAETLPETLSETVTETVQESPPSPSQGKGERNGRRVTVPRSPSPVPHSTSAPAPPDDDPPREDVERLCAHLADRVEANGCKRPAITRKWRDAARLLLDKDGRTEEQIHRAIDWCQDDEFWRGNVMAMPKLREQYDRLRLQAARGSPNSAGSHQAYRNPTDPSVYHEELRND